jgi:L-fuculose-phosphate aldolase
MDPDLKKEKQIRKQIAYTNRVCVESGLIRSSDGNISVRMNADRILVTPSGLYKRRLKPGQILVVDRSGALVRGEGQLKPSSELLMHLEVYEQREDIHTVLHAHPPYATALTIAGIPFPVNIVPEVITLVGEVATVPYATPGTRELAESISQPIKTHDAILLSNHGSLTVAATLDQALITLERIELAAQIYYLAANLGNINLLPEEEISRLMKMKAGSNGI